MAIQEERGTSQKLWHGFYSGPIRSDYTEEQALAQLEAASRKRPCTRESLAAQKTRLFRQMSESQQQKKDEPSKTD